MVPWAGRIGDGVLRWRGEEHSLPAHLLPPHAIHGTLLESAWDVAATDASTATLAAALVPPWPYGGRVVHRVRLEADALHAELEVRADDRAMPVIVGWHPWFVRVLRGSDGAPVGGSVEVDLPAGGMLQRGPDGIPTGEVVRPIPPGPWDDCFVDLARAPVVRWPGTLEVTVESSARWWVVFTERDEGICVEPQTGPPNGLNTGEHVVVEPGRPLLATMTIAWRRPAG
jgi:galactose mutarotase-like enzyme